MLSAVDDGGGDGDDDGERSAVAARGSGKTTKVVAFNLMPLNCDTDSPLFQRRAEKVRYGNEHGADFRLLKQR